MVTYYAYAVEYGQYLTDTVSLNHAAELHLPGIPYGPTDIHTFLSRNTALVTSNTYHRVALPMEVWQKKISTYGLTMEKISPKKEKITTQHIRKNNPTFEEKTLLTGTVRTKLTADILIYEVTEEKIVLTPRAVMVDESEDCSIIHFEKKDPAEK